MHDNIQQQLAGLGRLAHCLAERLAKRSSSDAEPARELAVGIGNTATDVHRLARDSIPLEIEANGLKVALFDLSAKVLTQHGIIYGFRSFGDIKIGKIGKIASSFIATHLYQRVSACEAWKSQGKPLSLASVKESWQNKETLPRTKVLGLDG